MGFGLVSFGWLFFADIPWKIDFLADFIGCFFIIMGARKLKPYSVHFGNAAKWFGILMIPSLAITAMEAAFMITEKQVISEYLVHVEVVHTLIFAVATYFLLLGVIRISTDVGREKIARKCRRNMGISAVAMVFYMVTRLLANTTFGEDKWTRLLRICWLVANVVWYLALVFNFIQLFSCYMWICYEGDEDMPMYEHSMKTNPYARFAKQKEEKLAEREAEYAPKKKKKKKK